MFSFSRIWEMGSQIFEFLKMGLCFWVCFYSLNLVFVGSELVAGDRNIDGTVSIGKPYHWKDLWWFYLCCYGLEHAVGVMLLFSIWYFFFFFFGCITGVYGYVLGVLWLLCGILYRVFSLEKMVWYKNRKRLKLKKR